MIETAVILAGGFGTRLASVVRDLPKPMAPVAGRPFLEHLLDHLQAQGLARIVLAVGYRRDAITDHFGNRYRNMQIDYVNEDEPLGTGGALRQAFVSRGLDQAFALNGDTFCDLDLHELASAHAQAGTRATLALVRQADASRYGAVELDARGHVQGFREKSPQPQAGLINAGVYALDSAVFELAPDATRFSFESEVLQAHAGSGCFGARVFDRATFIDIGVPEDFARAQTLLA